ARRREPVLAGELHVHKDEVGPARAQDVERLGRRARDLDGVALELEHGSRQHLVGLVVLDDEDVPPGLCHFAPFLCAMTRLSRPTISEFATARRLRICETRPLRRRLSASVRFVAVTTMIGTSRVDSSARKASTTSKPVTSGIIRSRRMKSGRVDLASWIASR